MAGAKLLRRLAKMDVHIVPVLEDNYAYVLVDRATKDAAVVDPAEAHKVVSAVQAAGVNVKAVLTTHHHADHAGGNDAFVKSIAVPVYGGDNRVQGMTNLVRDGDEFKVGQLHIKVLHTPCHTTDSVNYLVTHGDSRAIFTGDTLFVAGCGRFFEGTAPQMQHNMQAVYAKLPGDTQVYPGHEYTVANLKFAASLEPNNAAIKHKLHWAAERRAANQPTVPSTLGEEHDINPFMRTSHPDVQAAAKTSDPTATMATIRELKNSFKANI